jgi:hypothetical protein
MATKKRTPSSSSNQKPNAGKGRKLIRFDFKPGATPEEVAKGINDMVKKYRKGSEPEKPDRTGCNRSHEFSCLLVSV